MSGAEAARQQQSVGASAGPTGAAWMTLLEAAAVRVTEYLVHCTRGFEPTAPLAAMMLLLIDRGTLRDVLVARTQAGLCGCCGCGRAPRVLERRRRELGDGGAAGLEWGGAEEAAEEAVYAEAVGEAGDADEEAEEAEEPDAEELVYEDDHYTAHSFRLAARQQRQLEHLRHARELRQRQRLAEASAAPQQHHRPQSALGVGFEERFCGPECLARHEAEIRARVRPYADPHDPHLPRAIANLFPQIPAAALARLAAPHPPPQSQPPAPGPGVAVVAAGEVREKNVDGGAGSQTPPPPPEPAAAPTEDEADPLLLRRTLEQMQVLRAVWDGEAHGDGAAARQAPGSGTGRGQATASAPAAPRRVTFEVDTAKPSRKRDGSEEEDEEEEEEEAVGLSLLRAGHLLSGALCVLQVLHTSVTPATHALFDAHYARRRGAVRAAAAKAAASATGSGEEESLLLALLQPRMAALEARWQRRQTAGEGEGGAPRPGEADDGLRVRPDQQQARRELFLRYVLSADAAAALGRLLLLEAATLSHGLWETVWLSPAAAAGAGAAAASATTLQTLRFPFALPAAVAGAAGGRSPEALALSLAVSLAAACCAPALWEEAAGDGAEVAAALPDVLDCLGVAPPQMAECLRVLLGD